MTMTNSSPPPNGKPSSVKHSEQRTTTTTTTISPSIFSHPSIDHVKIYIYKFLKSFTDVMNEFCPVDDLETNNTTTNNDGDVLHGAVVYPTSDELARLERAFSIFLREEFAARKRDERDGTWRYESMERIQALPFVLRPSPPATTATTTTAMDLNDGYGTSFDHCRQMETWDCGIACLQMIVRWAFESPSKGEEYRHDDEDESMERHEGNHAAASTTSNTTNRRPHRYGKSRPLWGIEKEQRSWMLRTIDTRSIWTIDLMFVLDELRTSLLRQNDADELRRGDEDEDEDHEGKEYRNSRTNEEDIEGKNRPSCPTDSSFEFPRYKQRRRRRNRKSSSHSTSSSSSASSKDMTFLFCSRNLGVDETYEWFNYYKQSFRSDEHRVKHLFQKYKNDEHGITHKNSNLDHTINRETTCSPLFRNSFLDMNFVLSLLSEDNVVAIALLDNNIFLNGHGNGIDDHHDDVVIPSSSSSSEGNNDTNSKRSIPKSSRHKVQDSFSGHYIILCGVSFDPIDVKEAERNAAITITGSGSNSYSGIRDGNDGFTNTCRYCLVVKNPGSVNATDFVTPSHFERAWRATGTDHDIIFVGLHE